MIGSLSVVVPRMRLLDRSVDPCNGDYTRAVLVLSNCVFLQVPWLFYTLHLAVPQVQLIFKDVDFPVVAQKFFPWSSLFGFSLFFSQLPYM